MRGLIFCLVAGALAGGCGDNVKVVPDDASTVDAAVPADGAPDAAPDASTVLGPCLDRPTDLPMPPNGQLPCELLPPGFGS